MSSLASTKIHDNDNDEEGDEEKEEKGNEESDGDNDNCENVKEREDYDENNSDNIVTFRFCNFFHFFVDSVFLFSHVWLSFPDMTESGGIQD